MPASEPWRFHRVVGGLLFSITAWTLISALFLLIRTFGTGDTPDWMTGPGPVVLIIFLAGIILGGLDWGGDLVVDHSRLRGKPFWVLLLVKSLSLTFALFILILLGRLLAVATGQLTFAEFPASYLEIATSSRIVAAATFLAVAALLMAFIRQCGAMVGPRILVNLMVGRYHQPREEELIFMFLDMRSSTTIAERLGHRKFSRLLQDTFRDLTDVAIKHRVEIYKYVGDEAILSWRPRDGLVDSNCVATFFSFCNALEARRTYYESTYDCFPEFKAGLNIGPVTIAEVGVLKREIAYLSDVLNTAARIQGMCNDLGCGILLSDALRDRLPPEAPYEFTPRGEISLRGREEDVALFSVDGKA